MATRFGRRLGRRFMRHRGMAEHAAVGIFDTASDGRYRFVNPMLAQIYGYPTPEALRSALAGFPHHLYVTPGRSAALLRLLAERESVDGLESQIRRPDGRRIWVRESAHTVRNVDGRLIGFEGTVEDITERVRAETERDRSRAALEKALEQLDTNVQKRTKELAAANAILRAEIEDRRHAEHALAAAHDELAAAEAEKKRFYREVIRCVTRGKFHLIDAEEMPDAGELLTECPLETAADEPLLRHTLRHLAADAGMIPCSIDDLELAVGEAATNAVKHAGGGRSQIYCGPEFLAVRVSDRGAGIRPGDLPPTILQPGFSGAESLGMGYTLILALVDRIWLATDHNGTIVQLEKRLGAAPSTPTDKLSLLLTAWDRL